MPFHCFERTCHLSLGRAAVPTFQQEICDAGRGMQTNSEGTRCKAESGFVHVPEYQEGERDRERAERSSGSGDWDRERGDRRSRDREVHST